MDAKHKAHPTLAGYRNCRGGGAYGCISGENYMPQLLRMTGAGAVAALCYRLSGNTDKAGYYTLTAFWTLLAAGSHLISGISPLTAAAPRRPCASQ